MRQAPPSIEQSALEEAAAANKAYLILKFDGERTSKRYTTVFSASHTEAGVIRIDSESMGECLAQLLTNVIELKKADRIL